MRKVGGLGSLQVGVEVFLRCLAFHQVRVRGVWLVISERGMRMAFLPPSFQGEAPFMV